MARTKPIVVQVTHKCARTGREISLGVKAFNPRELVRASLTSIERGKVVASLEESKRLGHSSRTLLEMSEALDGKVSGLPRIDQAVEGATHEQVAVGDGGGASNVLRKKRATKTEEERDAAKLAIDGTGLLDPRKADPHAFGVSAAGGMRTRRSTAKQGANVGDIVSTDAPNTPAISKREAAGFLESKDEAKVEDAYGFDPRQQTEVDVDMASDCESELSDVPSNISAPKQSVVPSIKASVIDHVVSNGGELAQTIQPTVNSNASTSSSTASPTKADKRRTRFEVELETIGTPLIQEKITAPGAFLRKEYSEDGKKWYNLLGGSEKPAWALYERDVDIRHYQ